MRYALISTVFVVLCWGQVSVAVGETEAKQCFNGGELKHLFQGNSHYQTRLNSDKTFALLGGNHAEDSFDVLNLKTGTLSKLKKPAGTVPVLTQGDQIALTELGNINTSLIGADLMKALQKAKTTLIDLKMGTRSVVFGKVAIINGLFEASRVEGSTLVLVDESGNEFKVNPSGNQSNDPVLRRYSESGRDPNVTFDKRSKRLTVEQKGKRLFSAPFEYSGENLSGTFSPDARYFITRIADQDSRLAVIDLKSGRQNKFEVPGGYSFYPWGSSGLKTISSAPAKLILASYTFPNDGLKTLDLATGAVSLVTKVNGTHPEFSPDGSRICFHSRDSKMLSSHVCVNATTGEVVSQVPIPLNTSDIESVTANIFVLMQYGGNGQEGQKYLFRHQEVCATSVPFVECNCMPVGKTDAVDTSNVKKLTLGVACSKPFAEKDWKNLVDPNAVSVSEESGLAALRKFSKPGGFDSKRNLGLLLGLIKADFPVKYPTEFRGAMVGVLTTSSVLYDSLSTRFPSLKKMKEAPDLSCLVAAEQERVRGAIRDYTKIQILNRQKPKFDELAEVTNLARHTLSADQRETLAELAADQLVFSAGDSPELNQIFPSKVYKFAEARMKSALGLPYKELTDITVVRDGSQLKFIQLGVSPSEGSSPTIAGFFRKELKSVEVSNLPDGKATESFEWVHAGKNYLAQIALNKHKLEREIVSTAKSPDYKAMWKDKTFRGVVIAGSNMGSGLTEPLIKQYLAYYTEQGFSFAAPVVNSDIPKYLEERVSGKEPMHYFVKEAHSDGDEKNLFRLGKTGKILVGKKVTGGKTEIIELVYPTADSTSHLVSNQDFGKWIRAREKSGGPELVYVNSSCWSKSKAAFEIAAAASPTLINIPSKSIMYTFINREDTVMYAVVDGLRKQKSYAEIREAMKKDPRYQSKTSNILLFPDEEEYKTQVTDVIRVPVDVNSRLFEKRDDGSLRDCSIEETH